MADRKPHLLVNGVGSREDFQSRSRRRSPEISLQDRHQHGIVSPFIQWCSYAADLPWAACHGELAKATSLLYFTKEGI